MRDSFALQLWIKPIRVPARQHFPWAMLADGLILTVFLEKTAELPAHVRVKKPVVRSSDFALAAPTMDLGCFGIACHLDVLGSQIQLSRLAVRTSASASARLYRGGERISNKSGLPHAGHGRLV